MKLRAKALSTGLVIGALVALGAMLFGGTTAASAGSDAVAAAKKGNCKEAKNVEAILDDSGSMSSSDPSKFRTAFLNAFANIGSNNGRLFGGVEFGDTSNVLFGPATIPGVASAMQASFVQVDANNGGTDYQEAFTGATAHNGTADARIFLTDGVPTNEPPNTTAHQTGVKTYVIGVGPIVTDPSAQAVLNRIASETGGPPPFLIFSATDVQPVAATIAAAVDCKAIQTFTDVLETQGDQAKHSSKAKGKTMDVFASWNTVGTVINVQVEPVTQNKAGASAVAAKVQKNVGANFVSIRVKGLKKGQKVKIKAKAKTMAVPTTLTTQVIK